MCLTNPFADNAPTDPEDGALVTRVRSDAEDATQEILIKAVTRLASFEGRSSFRTWLYRLVVNHVLNMKRGRIEETSLDFRSYGQALPMVAASPVRYACW